MEAFVGPVIAHLGKNLLSDLWDGDVDSMTVDEVKAMNVSLLRRFLRAKNSAVYAADARRRAATNVKMAAVLADAIGGSFVVDLYQRHGIPIATCTTRPHIWRPAIFNEKTEKLCRDDSETSQCLLRKAPGWVPLKPPIPPVKLRVV